MNCTKQWDESLGKYACANQGCTHKASTSDAPRNCNGDGSGQPTLPPIREQLTHLKQDLRAAAKDLGRRVTRAQRLERLRICAACPEIMPDDNRCSQCGCVLKAKASLRAWNCDLGKWPPIP